MNTTPSQYQVKRDMFHPQAVHVMIDLETGGLCSGRPIYQIAAVPFVLQNSSELITFQPFNEYISANDVELAWQPDPQTLAWWEQQDEAIKARVFSGTKFLEEVLSDLASWFHQNLNFSQQEVFVWGNGADFDIAQLTFMFDWYEITGVKNPPWSYSNVRCFRTLKGLYPTEYKLASEMFQNQGKHDALCDAVWQAQVATQILNGVMPLSATLFPEAP